MNDTPEQAPRTYDGGDNDDSGSIAGRCF